MSALELAKQLQATTDQLVAQVEADAAELQTLRTERSEVIAGLLETRAEMLDRVAAIERRIAAIQPHPSRALPDGDRPG